MPELIRCRVLLCGVAGRKCPGVPRPGMLRASGPCSGMRRTGMLPSSVLRSRMLRPSMLLSRPRRFGALWLAAKRPKAPAPSQRERGRKLHVGVLRCCIAGKVGCHPFADEMGRHRRTGTAGAHQRPGTAGGERRIADRPGGGQSRDHAADGLEGAGNLQGDRVAVEVGFGCARPAFDPAVQDPPQPGLGRCVAGQMGQCGLVQGCGIRRLPDRAGGGRCCRPAAKGPPGGAGRLVVRGSRIAGTGLDAGCRGITAIGARRTGRPPATGLVQPPAAGLVQLLVAGIVVPLAVGIVEPLTAGIVQPLAVGVVLPPASGIVEPPAAAIVGPPAAGIIERSIRRAGGGVCHGTTMPLRPPDARPHCTAGAAGLRCLFDTRPSGSQRSSLPEDPPRIIGAGDLR
jgi:hypothetical protein